MSPDKYQILPPLSDEEYEALKADIAARGVLVPVEVDEEGNTLDGHHRLRACEELGIRDYPRMRREGMTEQEKTEHLLKLNLARRQLTKEQLKELAEKLWREGWSQEDIGKALGVDHWTVGRWTSNWGQSLNAQTRIEPSCGKTPQEAITELPPRTNTRGQQRPRKYKPRKPKATFLPDANTDLGTRQPVAATMFSSVTDEYWTPLDVVEAARRAMGGIDLDPASCAEAQAYINAGAYYTVADDGLLKPWFGRVWLNPPYGYREGKSNQMLWSERLVADYRAGRVSEAILLVKAALGYGWFERLWDEWPVCFPRERLAFARPTLGDEGQSKQGSALFYLGSNVDGFVSTFVRFGRIILPGAQCR